MSTPPLHKLPVAENEIEEHPTSLLMRGGTERFFRYPNPFPLRDKKYVDELRELPIDQRRGIWDRLYNYFYYRMLQHELDGSHTPRETFPRMRRASRKAHEVYHRYFPDDPKDPMSDSDSEMESDRQKVYRA